MFFFHLGAALLLASVLPIPLQSTANTLLFPLAGVLVGLSFSWGGNAVALLQTSEVEVLAENSEGGLQEYVYTFQSAVLCFLVTIVLWGLAGLGIFDLVWPVRNNCHLYYLVSVVLFFFSSLAVREGWHVVLGSQQLLLVRNKLRRAQASSKPK